MPKSIMDADMELLFRAVLTLKDVNECMDFFEDLCTVKEIGEMSRRFRAAEMLDDNKIYTEIAEETGLSTATISRVNRCLKYGSDGYVRALARLKSEKR